MQKPTEATIKIWESILNRDPRCSTNFTFVLSGHDGTQPAIYRKRSFGLNFYVCDVVETSVPTGFTELFNQSTHSHVVGNYTSTVCSEIHSSCCAKAWS